MSAIALFIKLPKAALDGLRMSASGGSPYNYLKLNGREVCSYGWSGDVLVTLLPYLEEKFQIDLMKSEYGELSLSLTEATDATHFIFTTAHKNAFLGRLDPALFSEGEMRQYFNEFNATNEQQIGQAMLAGIRCIQESLGQIDDDSVVVFVVG